MLVTPSTPSQAINAVLDRAQLPHIRHLRCLGLGRCRGTVAGRRTEWRVTVNGRALLICICYLTNPPKPIPKP